MSPGDRWAQTKREAGQGVCAPGHAAASGRPARPARRGERMFDTMGPCPSPWRSGGSGADDDGGQPMLFAEEELVDRHVGIGEYRGLEFLHVNARRVINEVPAGSQMPFRYTINAYRGCSHACAYCFARPTHEYLGLGIGEDFERKLVVKVNAVERVRAELRSPRWRGEHIAMGTNTDPYQRAEGRYHLTRGIVEALGEARNPVLDPDQVDADPARPRAPRGGARRAPTCTATSPSARSTRRCGRPPSRAPRIPGAGSRRCAGSTMPASPPVS